MHRALVVAVAVVALAVGACGGSSSNNNASTTTTPSGQTQQQQARTQVCDARNSIAHEVDTLKGVKVSTATLGQIRTSLTTIRDDLQKIANAQPHLNSQRKAQVQQANQRFRSQVTSIASSVASGTSLSQAKSQLGTALQQLGTTYRQTLAKVDCAGA